MNEAERQLFHEVARTFTGVACLAQTLSVECRTSGHGTMANPAQVEGRLWHTLADLRTFTDRLPAVREAARIS